MDFGNLKTRKEAWELLCANWRFQPHVEPCRTQHADGRVLAEDQYASCSIPVFRASAMDGIAVNFDRFRQGTPDTAQWQEGREYVRADTGDDFDDAYDTVIPIEWVTFPKAGGIQLDCRQTLKRGMHVMGKGTMQQEGSLLLEAHTLLTGRHLAVLAAGGIAEVPVIQKPRVGFVPTGSELVPLGQQVSRGNNIDSNSVMVAALLREMGAEPTCYPIVKDRQEDLERVLDKAVMENDMVIINGGSSKGKEDFNTRLLQKKGDLLCHGVAAVPGRPMGIGIVDGKAVVNLAGPSMACFYGMDWLVRSMVCRWLGIQVPRRKTAQVVLQEDVIGPPLELLVFLELTEEGGVLYGRPHARGETGRHLPAMAAGGLFITELGHGSYKKGETVAVELL